MEDTTGFVERNFSAQDGLRLSARIYGEWREGRLPVVCLAGLSRNARDFHGLALYLSREAADPRLVVALDYRGRGRSRYDPDWGNYAVPVEAQDVLAGMAAFGIDRAAFVGTSRGGLNVFSLAAMRPTVLGPVVLNDIGPVIEGAGLAQIRAWLERAPPPADMDEAVAIHKAAAGAAFPALSDEDWRRNVEAFYRMENGRPVPDYDPALLKTLRGIDLSVPLPVYWPQFAGLARLPLLAIRGENSTLFSAETLAEMQRRHPGMEAVTVPGQAHPPLLETAGLPERIAGFLDRAETRLERRADPAA